MKQEVLAPQAVGTSAPLVQCHVLHGLTVSSEVNLPPLPVRQADPDISVRLGDVPEHLENPRTKGVLFEAAPSEYLLHVKSVASFCVRNGCEVVVSRAARASDTEVAAFLLGPVISAALHQRGLFVLHASGVAGARGAVLISGHSGRGKSTITAALAARGYRIVTDDAAVVTFDAKGAAFVHQGVPQLRLWADAARRFGYDPTELTRVRSGVGKYVVAASHQEEPLAHRLSAVFVLESHAGNSVESEAIEQSAAFSELCRHTRIPRVMLGLGMRATHFRSASALAARVPITIIRRPSGLAFVDDVANCIEPALM